MANAGKKTTVLGSISAPGISQINRQQKTRRLSERAGSLEWR
jgi:hypothetical protein